MRFWWLTLSSLTIQGIRVQDSDSLQRLLGSCVQPWLPDETACSARSIREMPTLLDEAVYTVEYASHPISSNGLKSLSELLSFTHSALVITEAWQVFSAEQTQPSALLFEYFARDFGPKAILPASISDGGIPIWENQAVVGWRVAADKGEWLQGANRTTVGTATGKILNQWFREVVLWGKRHPGYNLFNLWDSTDAVTRKSYMGDSVCHSFTEWSLVDLFRLGADFAIQHPLCRNYFSFITNDSPRKLNMTTPADSQTVLEFYKRLEPLTSRSFHDLPEFSSNLLSAVRGEISQSPGEVVLFQRGLEDSGAGEYFRADLVKPYFGVKPSQLAQRMILPWQNIPANIEGECAYGGSPKRLGQGRLETDDLSRRQDDWEREIETLDQKEMELHQSQLRLIREQTAMFIRDLSVLQGEVTALKEGLSGSLAPHSPLQNDFKEQKAKLLSQEQLTLSLQKRVDFLERLLGESVDRHAQEIFKAKTAHAKLAGEAKAREAHHASVADRLGYIEQLVGDSFDKHSKEIQTSHSRLESLHSRLTACESQANQDSLRDRVDFLEKLLGESSQKHAE
ncbi:unnamed protein product, partial [Symbiodinium necroappetens]